MKLIFYVLLSALVYPLAVSYEGACRWSERKATHAKPRPPAVRASGRHRAGSLLPAGTAGEVAV